MDMKRRQTTQHMAHIQPIRVILPNTSTYEWHTVAPAPTLTRDPDERYITTVHMMHLMKAEIEGRACWIGAVKDELIVSYIE